MEARNRSLPEWFERIRTRQISLPRFQRNLAWGPNEVAGLLTTVLRGLPSGATLILEVGDRMPFIHRPMVDAPQQGERITELLLDGQQRLTALWRSLHNSYPDRTYFVFFEEDPNNPDEQQPGVFGESRYFRKLARYPIWADRPAEVWSRGYIPLALLRPGDINEEIDHWIESIAGDDRQQEREISRTIHSLRDRVKLFNLPFLSLPVTTPRQVALEVFIKMNTSSVPLTTFDIIVAQVEAEAGESLHDLVAKLHMSAPSASQYKSAEDLILDVAALMQDRVPNQAGYGGLDLAQLVTQWEELTSNIAEMARFLEGESIYDSTRLPTEPVLAVIAALFGYVSDKPDSLGNARRILRKYLWRSFFTSRYDRAAASAALVDFRALRRVFTSQGTEDEVPAFNDRQYPLATKEELIGAAWPRNRNTLARGVLALSLLKGARDIADEALVTREHLKSREYHHLFPNSLLQDAGLQKEEIFRALNCALITWKTNRTISNKEPMQYLRERAEANELGEDILRARLRTHLIDYDSLNVGGWVNADGHVDKEAVKSAYFAFLENRASLMGESMELVCSGKSVT